MMLLRQQLTVPALANLPAPPPPLRQPWASMVGLRLPSSFAISG